MSCKILDGKSLSEKIEEDLSTQISAIKKQRGFAPELHIVLVGEDGPSKLYVSTKEKACKRVGITFGLHAVPSKISQEELFRLVHQLNENQRVDAIIVQLPLPMHIDTREVFSAIDPAKDVDGFHPINAGRLFSFHSPLEACTPKGILALLDHYQIEIHGKHAVVVGRSAVVGRPMAIMLLRRNATVTICHRYTDNLGDFTRHADILVSAVGKPNLIRGNMIKKGAVVIDVGISRTTANQIVGDVCFEEAKEICSAISPVPGGVGPMTVGMLLTNTCLAAQGRAS